MRTMTDQFAFEAFDPELKNDLERLQSLAGPTDPLVDADDGDSVLADGVDAHQDPDSGSSFNLFDPSFFGVDASDWPLDDLVDEETVTGSSVDHQKLDQAEKRYLPFARKREGRQALKKVTVEDFDSREERIAFLAIEKHKVDLFGHKANYKSRRSAVEWFFCHMDDGGLTFDLCARLLDSRPDVLRLRIHYEFWLRWMVFSDEFPFMTVPVPDIIRGEILYNANTEGLEVAQEAWLQPGISTDALLLKASGADSISSVPEKYKRALDLLESAYILSIQHEGWYLTGRNPLLQRLDLEKNYGRSIAGTSVHWSRLFFSPRV